MFFLTSVPLFVFLSHLYLWCWCPGQSASTSYSPEPKDTSISPSLLRNAKKYKHRKPSAVAKFQNLGSILNLDEGTVVCMQNLCQTWELLVAQCANNNLQLHWGSYWGATGSNSSTEVHNWTTGQVQTYKVAQLHKYKSAKLHSCTAGLKWCSFLGWWEQEGKRRRSPNTFTHCTLG